MRKMLFGLSTVGVLLATSSHVDARMLLAASDWSVNRVETTNPYCTLAREYEAGAVVTFAKNVKGEGTIAIDFQRDAFDVTRPYPITLRAGDVLRQYVVKPANNTTIIMRTSTDVSLFEGMSETSKLNIQIDSEKFDLDLSGYTKAFLEMNNCAGVSAQVAVASNSLPKAPLSVQNVETKTPRPPILQEEVDGKSTQIANLLEENRRLTQELSVKQEKVVVPPSPRPAPVTTPVQAQVAPSGTASVELLNKLADAEKRNLELMRKVSALETQIAKAQTSFNPDLSAVVAEKETQIASLQSQNEALKKALTEARSATPEVVVKEIIKEVPVVPSGMSADDGEMTMRLADAETQAMSFKAERDEYRRLLQTERQRIKDMGDMAGQLNGIDGKSSNLIEDVRRLEREKVDLIRELEFVKSSVDPSVDIAPVADNQKAIDALSNQLDDMKAQLNKLAIEKQSLQVDLAQAQSASVVAKQKLAEMQVNAIAQNDNTADDLELQTMRAEIASLEAQNLTLREDVARLNAREPEVVVKEVVKGVIKKVEVPVASMRSDSSLTKTAAIVEEVVSTPSAPVQKVADVAKPLVNKVTGKVVETQARQDLRNKIQNQNSISKQPVKPSYSSDVSSIVPEIQPQKLVALSGDEIRQLVSASRIPLQSQVGRVNSVSGPDFAAFKWDTGMVYGSAEQSRLSDVSAFVNSVQRYIQKTKSRCGGSFDENVSVARAVKGITVQSVDIACVDNMGEGSGASILFFEKNGMFYAMAHEADMNSFEIAMDMRERLSSALKSVF